jgi:ParB family chromosome partitioning protein
MFDPATTATAEATSNTAPNATLMDEGQLTVIPLNKLDFDSDNVRKRGGTNVDELKALIDAQGLLQNLVVCPQTTKRGKPNGKFGVVAGGRRLRALRALAEEGKIAKDKPIECRVMPREQAILASTSENSGREDMTGPDKLQAFMDMVRQGHGVEELSHRFGISVLTVQRRVKLANVSPRLFALYADEQISIDQLMALAVIDDHAQQEAIWDGAPPHHRDAYHLRRMALGEAVNAATDRMARFVGLDAYIAAGGQVTRDLFSENDQGYCNDPVLLAKLASELLETERARLIADGVAWVDVVDLFNHATRQEYLLAPTTQRNPTKTEKAALKEARNRLALAEKAMADFQESDEEPEDDNQYETLDQAVDDALAQVEELEGNLRVVNDDVKELCGVVLCIDQDGCLATHRYLIRKADAKKAAAAQRGDSTDGDSGTEAGGEASGDQEPKDAGLSDALVRRLSAQKTMAVQVELALNGQVAMAVLAYTLLGQVRLSGSGRVGSSISGTNRDADLKLADPSIDSSKAWEHMASLIASIMAMLPEDEDNLLPWLIEQPMLSLVQILSLCTALTVYNGTAVARQGVGHLIPQALNLDMANYWCATGETYFKSVPKALIADAIASVDPEAAKTVDKLKKGEAVALAESLLKDTRWLPAALQPVQVQ